MMPSRSTLYTKQNVRDTVRQAALMITEGYSLRATCTYLTEHGYSIRQGKAITPTSLWRLLVDRQIIAVGVDKLTGLRIEPVVSEALFFRLSERLRQA